MDSSLDFTIGNPVNQMDDWQMQTLPDTCAVVSEMSIINQFGFDLSQDQAAFISAEHGWYQPGCGTSPDVIGNMMDLFNIPNHTCRDASVADLARELQQGHGVIVGVRSADLWHGGDLDNFICKTYGLDNSTYSPADHAVVVTGIDVSDPSNPMVIINDSGTPDGAAAAYPLEQFMDAWENSNFYYTATDVSIPVTHGSDWDMVNNVVDWSHWLPSVMSLDSMLFPNNDHWDLTSVEGLFSDSSAICMI